MIGFGLNCQSNLKNGFGLGLTITYLQWIWIGLTIQKNSIEQQPGNSFPVLNFLYSSESDGGRVSTTPSPLGSLGVFSEPLG